MTCVHSTVDSCLVVRPNIELAHIELFEVACLGGAFCLNGFIELTEMEQEENSKSFGQPTDICLLIPKFLNTNERISSLCGACFGYVVPQPVNFEHCCRKSNEALHMLQTRAASREVFAAQAHKGWPTVVV